MTVSDWRASFLGFLPLAVALGLGAGCKGGSGALGYPDAAGGTRTGGRGMNSGGGAGTTDGGTGGAAAGGGSPDDGGATDAIVGASGGSGGGSGAGGTGGSGAGTGGGVGTSGGSGGGGTGGGGGTTTTTGNMRLLGGPAALISPGISCSTPATPAGGVKPDQWCGVIKPGTAVGTFSLAVFNLTKAMAGTALTCTAGDPNCVALSASISTDAPHGFFGETLIYYDAQSVFAWKPGWTAGRVLLQQDQLASCVAAPGVATAICIKLTADAAVQNLYGGRIDTQTGAALTLIEPISADFGNVTFSTDFQSVVWSTKASATALEVLKIQTIGDAATPRTVASNVTGWAQTPDGLRWLWLSQPMTDSTTGWTTGTLQTSPFPAGTSPTNVHTAVVQYAPWSNKSLVVLATPGSLGADLKAITDIDNPTTSAKTIEAADVLGFSGLTSAGTVLYFNDFLPDDVDPNRFSINLLTSKSDASGKCAVTTAPEADPSATLSPSGTGVTWARLNAAGTGYEGIFTPLPGCSPRTFSTSAASFFEVGSGVVVQENFDAQAFTAALAFVPLAPDGSPGTKVVVDPAADTIYMPLFPALPRVVYSVNQTVVDSGIYVSGALTGTPAAFRLQRTPSSAAVGPLASMRPTTRAALPGRLRPTIAGGTGLRPSASPPAFARTRFVLPPQ